MGMNTSGRAERIQLTDFHSPPMRAFHFSWFAFFICFFAWFGIAPLMAVVRDDLHLTKAQIGNTIIASVAITILVRLLIGPLCDRFGPRKTYRALLMVGAIPVVCIGLANNYTTFLLFRLAIGAIGASFVITQYHTSVMFAPRCVGTANATTAGWGNLGGGVTQMLMPLLFGAIIALGATPVLGWRLAMIVPGVIMFITGYFYGRYTQDAPEGNFDELRASGKLPPAKEVNLSYLLSAARDPRVWALFVIYGGCFGVELTINNVAALYFHDHFKLDVSTAGIIAGLFGAMNLFARSLGGIGSDLMARRFGLSGRVQFLFVVMILEGIALLVFSQINVLATAIAMLIVFSLFVQMAEGATFGVVPFINKKALGAVAGIVGAGGNVGAVAAGFLFRHEGFTTQQALFWLGCAVLASGFATLLVRFIPEATPQANVAQVSGDLVAALSEEMAVPRN